MKKDTQYTDLELFKSVLESGVEEVPAGLWKSLEGKLPAAAPATRPFVLWLRRSAMAVSAAAAIAAGVVLTTRSSFEKDPSGIDILPTEEIVAQAAPAQVEPSASAAPKAAQTKQTKLLAQASSAAPVAATSAASEAPIAATSAESAANALAMARPQNIGDMIASEPKPSAAPAAKEAHDSVTDEAKVSAEQAASLDNGDPFAEPFEEKVKQRSSLAAFADALGNNSYHQPSPAPLRASGMKLPTTTTLKETSASSFGIPVSFGIGARIPISKKWSVGTGLNYSFLSRKFDGIYTEIAEDGSVLTSKSFDDISNRQHYIGIPINFYYSILGNKRIDFYTFAGGTFEKCVANRNIMGTGTDRIIYNGNRSGMQISVTLGLGFEYSISRNVGLYVDPSARYYFKMKQPKSIRTMQPLNAGFELGVRYKL